MQRSFVEAKGLVISDYQALLEKNWNEELMKKYPVKIDEEVLKTIIK
jgi:peptidyl-prolyl cis-trans isomerase SurA